jgi:F0F1-type ATP synthase assembly protein I
MSEIFSYLWTIVSTPFAAIGQALAWLVDTVAAGSPWVLVAELVAVAAVTCLATVVRARRRRRARR